MNSRKPISTTQMQKSPLCWLALCAMVSSLMMFSEPAFAYGGKTKGGITVTDCEFDFDEERYCTDAKFKMYARVMNTASPNFNNNLIVHTYKSTTPDVTGRKGSLRLLIIDPKKKIVHPFLWAIAEAKIAGKGAGIRKIEFSKESPRICVQGDIIAYKMSFDLASNDKKPFCFKYLGSNRKSWEDYVEMEFL